MGERIGPKITENNGKSASLYTETRWESSNGWTSFLSLIDAASLDSSEIIILGEFNIDLFKPTISWLDITFIM